MALQRNRICFEILSLQTNKFNRSLLFDKLSIPNSRKSLYNTGGTTNVRSFSRAPSIITFVLATHFRSEIKIVKWTQLNGILRRHVGDISGARRIYILIHTIRMQAFKMRVDKGVAFGRV